MPPEAAPTGDAPIALVDDPDALAALVEQLAPVPELAFDLEFLSQDRYAPTLCLVQLAWRDADRPDAIEVRLVDPLAVDVAPLVGLLGDGARTVIAHGARQDVGLIAAQRGVRVAGLFDTQIAAAFVGLGEQPGYARLAGAIVGARIDKESQWTDWDRRPLSPRQLRYAIADVAHLPAMHDALSARLGERRAWVLAESAAMVDDAWTAARVVPEDAWRAIGGARGLDRDSLAALIELASWRMRTAIAEDRPLGHVAPERGLVEVARARPSDERALRAVRGVAELRHRAADVLAVLAVAAERAATGEVPTLAPPGEPTSPRAQLWSEIVLALVAEAAEATGIAPRFLATRAEAEALVRAIDRAGGPDGVEHPVLSGWRREVVGERIAAWFSGDAALAADFTGPVGVKLH